MRFEVMNTSVEEKKGIIRWIVNEIYNKKNLAAIDEVATTDPILHTTTGDHNGPEGWKQVSSKFLTAFPDFNITIDDLIAEGDTVVDHWSAHGTHQGPLGNLKPTGKRIKITGVAIFRFDDTKNCGRMDFW